jgi:SSS family solute:Na+ symporter
MFTIFAVVLIYFGFITKKWINDSSDYLLAGREVSLVINAFGVAAIGFAGTAITLCPGFMVLYVVKGALAFGTAFLFAGLMLYGLVFAKFIRRCGAQTLSEWLEMRFDSRTRTIVTISTVLGLLGILANNIVSMAITVSGFTAWNYLITTSVIFAMFLLFTYAGGLWAVTLTDFMQMIIGLIALPLTTFGLMSRFGGINLAISGWPGPAGIMDGGITGLAMPVMSLRYPSVLTMFLLFAMFLVWGNNYYWLRVASCRSERVAKLSYVYASLILFFAMYSLLYIIGIYAGTYQTSVFAGGVSPMAAFGVALRALPTFIASFALLGALAASISTATTAHMGATGTAVRDIYARLINPRATAKELVKPSKVIMLGLGILVWFLCFYPGGPTYLFAFANAWLGPPAVLVFYGAFWPRATKDGAFWGAIISISAMMVITILDLTKIWSITQYMHQGVFGLIITLVITTTISLVTKPRYYGEQNWKLDSDVEYENIELNEFDFKALSLIRRGFVTMGEITDLLDVDSSISNESIEKLDKMRLIKRDALSGSGFYLFSITNKGISRLPVTSSFEEKLLDMQLTKEELDILSAIEKGISQLYSYIESNEIGSLKFSVYCSKLIRNGYLLEGGLLKRTITLTEKGKQAILGIKDLGINQGTLNKDGSLPV